MSSIFHSIAAFAIGIITAVSSMFGGNIQAPAQGAVTSDRLDVYHYAQTRVAFEGQQSERLGASNAIPTVIALFETSLASGISGTATSFTLTSATDLAGTTLASSTYAFIIDEGTASQELVLADCTGTACTNVARGLSVVTGTTTVTALEHSHRRGASVKITDGPQLNIISRIINGIASFPNKISYTSAPTFTNGLEIIDKTYADNLIIAGGTAGSPTVPGIFLTATQVQAASSTPSGTYLGQPYLYVVPASMATSSPGTTGLWVVITNNAGKIAQAFLDWTQSIAFSGNNTHSGSETFTGGVSISGAISVATTTTSSRFVGLQFGGDGSDGALSCSSGTTSIDLGSAAITTKNYTSISITGTCKVAFTNPASTGSIIIFRSQGNATITSSNDPAIDLQSLGGVGGAGSGSPGAGTAGNGGGGGSSMVGAGSNGTIGANTAANTPTTGSGFGTWIYSTTAQTGGAGSASCGNTTAAGGASPALPSSTGYYQQYFKAFVLPGSGGGGGCPSTDTGATTGGTGGRGAGALYMEVGGSLNKTGIIDARGATSTASIAASSGCGGGGGGGIIQIIYNYLTANSGSDRVNGGSGNGGTCTKVGGDGAGGLSSVKQNNFF